MTQPYDSCRLFYHMRNTAYPKAGQQELGGASGSGLIDLDEEIDHLETLGISRENARLAVNSLLDAELLHRLTPEDERIRGLEDRCHGHDVVFVEPLDDLTAATILFARV